MSHILSRYPRSTYYDKDYYQTAALIRARQPYLVKNIFTGLAICAFTISICEYYSRSQSAGGRFFLHAQFYLCFIISASFSLKPIDLTSVLLPIPISHTPPKYEANIPNQIHTQSKLSHRMISPMCKSQMHPRNQHIPRMWALWKLPVQNRLQRKNKDIEVPICLQGREKLEIIWTEHSDAKSGRNT